MVLLVFLPAKVYYQIKPNGKLFFKEYSGNCEKRPNNVIRTKFRKNSFYLTDSLHSDCKKKNREFSCDIMHKTQ